MASQPPPGTGLMSVDTADPELGSGTSPEPNSTSGAKRRRDTEAQPPRPSLTRGQLDATNAPLPRQRALQPLQQVLRPGPLQASSPALTSRDGPNSGPELGGCRCTDGGLHLCSDRSGQSSARPKAPLSAQDRPQA
ncbi:hypothetical protein CORC01_14227 [Colletotrichum orchidophilum]|uniref:Uncharacterized protein n=1 Tax=Colletotrichum orchidophilum TaxID=1209926 RepID=A0A1G4AN02_9PEZI|nr:uncharacterized protein CORC01_14227 [Colletotrichum orchidophilum]OHE90476.1 hypothetical protein CORC01_14227 [Colletotrichum orchidophilum]